MTITLGIAAIPSERLEPPRIIQTSGAPITLTTGAPLSAATRCDAHGSCLGLAFVDLLELLKLLPVLFQSCKRRADTLGDERL